MTKTIPKLFTKLKVVEVEIRKEHQVLMVNKTNSFMKKGNKNDGKVKRVYVIYMLLMCTLPELAVAPGYLILVLLLIFATRNRDYGLSEDWLRTRRCAWEMIPKSM